MSLAKTEKGRTALLNRDTSLGPRERQILVMCDGKRKYVDFLQFFGDDIKALLNRLMTQGYMLDVDAAALAKPDALSMTGTFRSDGRGGMVPARAASNASYASAPASASALGSSSNSGYDIGGSFSSSASAPLTGPAPLTTQPGFSPTVVAALAVAAAPATRSRRSIAATKMYMIDMLQLLRDMDSSSFAVSIQTSQDEADLVMNVLEALRYITRKSGPSYGKRVSERLGAMLPEAYLPDLDFMNAELFSESAPG